MNRFVFLTILFFCSLGLSHQHSDQIPHLDLEMSSTEYRALLAKSVATSQFKSGKLAVAIKLGERNLDWLKYINQHREIPLSLTQKGTLASYPIERANSYNENSIYAIYGPYRTDTLHFVPETSFTLFANQKGHPPAQL
jgi:hypothetical protein